MRSRSWFRKRLTALACAALVSGTGLGAQRQDALFIDDAPVVDAVPAFASALADGTRIRRTRAAGVRRDRLERVAAAPTGRLLVNLFADVAIEAVGERVERDAFGHTTWVGHAAGRPQSAVALTWGAAGLTGQISIDERHYAIEPGSPEWAIVRELEARTLPLELPARLPAGGPDATVQAAPASAAPAVVDLLVLYTSAARRLAGGGARMDAQVAGAVAATNAAFARSGILASLRAVGVREFFYVESLGGLAGDLDEIGPGGSMAAQVAQARRDTGADLVALITGRSGWLSACGVAWLGPSPQAIASVSEFACLGAGQWSFTHEIGHSFGADHAPGDPVVSPVPYARGYRDPVNRIRTLMAYPVPGSSPRILNFSSDVVLEPPGTGHPTGTSLQDNGRQITEVAPTVAAWMRDPGPPDPPTNLTALVSGSAVTLTWAAATGGGTAADFELAVGSAPAAEDHGRFVLAGPSFTFPSVGDGRYYARLRSRGPGGVSAFSPEIVVDVGAQCQPPGPAAVSASVAGRVVTLQWLALDGTGPTTYLVGVGRTSGGLDLGIADLGPLTGISVPAPAGRYFVRVAGRNACGLGPISGEIAVAVP